MVNQKYKQYLHPRQVTTATGYENMDSTERQIFFKAYRYDDTDGLYHLHNIKEADKIKNNWFMLNTET